MINQTKIPDFIKDNPVWKSPDQYIEYTEDQIHHMKEDSWLMGFFWGSLITVTLLGIVIFVPW